MHCRFLTEGPGRTEKPRMTVVDRRMCQQRIAWMQVEGHVKGLDGSPESAELRQVVVKHATALFYLREPVDQCTDEAEVLHTALEFARGQFRRLHRQRGEALEAVQALRDLLGEEVVRAARQVVRLLRIRNRLHSRRIERKNHQFDSV